MQNFEAKNNHSMKRMVEQRVRFYPALASAIIAADEIYERTHVSEAQLKALSIAATGGTQWACGSCGEHRKAASIMAAELGLDEADIKQRLLFRGESGGRRTLQVRYLPGRQGLINDAIEAGLLAETDRFWASIAAGLWSVPLLYKMANGKNYFAKEAERINWFQNEALQAVFVGQYVDELFASGVSNFGDVAKKFGAFIEHDKPDVYAFQAIGCFNRLIQAGHTAEV